MGALDLASVAARALRDARETTVFALCHDHDVRLTPRLDCGIQLRNNEIVFDPRTSLPDLCRALLLAFSRWLLPTGTDQDVANLADLLNTRVCQPALV